MRTAIRVFAPFLVAGQAYLAAATATHAGPTFEDQEVNRAYVRALAGATPGPATVTIAGPAQVELPNFEITPLNVCTMSGWRQSSRQP